MIVGFLLGFILALLLTALIIGFLTYNGIISFNQEEEETKEEEQSTQEGFKTNYDPERLLKQLLDK